MTDTETVLLRVREVLADAAHWDEAAERAPYYISKMVRIFLTVCFVFPFLIRHS